MQKLRINPCSMITGVPTNVPIIVFALCKNGRRVPTQDTTAPIHNEAGEIIRDRLNFKIS